MCTGRSAPPKCPYCDFNSHVHHGAFDEAAYVEAYKAEIGYLARLTKGRTVQSIFFGVVGR